MVRINSVLGTLDTSEMGVTLAHEHLLLASSGILRDYPQLLGSNKVERVVNALKEAKEGGINTLVDATTIDLGRDIHFMAEVSRRSGVNIIACTGWRLDVPRFIVGASPDLFAEGFIRDIEQGISGTDIKAGIIKAASDVEGVTPAMETILRAAARSHLRMGVPIMLHSYAAGQVARQQIAILKDEGVDLKKVKIDHANDTTDIEYLMWILDQGCYLGFDRYPGRGTSSLARTKTLKTLIDAGFANRICVSHDHWVIDCEQAFEHRWGMTVEERNKQNPYKFLYIKKVVFPQLLEMGVTQEVLDSLCVAGPRNFFEGV